MALTVVHHIRRMPGGTQSHMMRASDGNIYVVKFQNNPQHTRVLTNEMIVTQLGEAVGLPVTHGAIIQVDDWIIAGTPELNIQYAGKTEPCKPGLQYGSLFAVSPYQGQVANWVPKSELHRVRNLGAFAGMLVLDKWVCNTDSRQAVFWRRSRERNLTAAFIDHGYCFNNREWSFPDAPLRGAFPWNEVYASVTGWDSFEPWLSRIEQLNESMILGCSEIIPPEWYENDAPALENLLTTLIRRRSRVRELIEEFRTSSRNPFPSWSVAA